MTVPRKTQTFAKVVKVAVDPTRGVAYTAGVLREALERDRILHVSGGPPDTRQAFNFWEEVNRILGRIDLRSEDPLTLERRSSIWSDIQYDPALASAYRHSKTAQPLHTDGAFNAMPPSIGFFLCEKQAPKGGATTFLDVDVLCDVLEREQPNLYASLRSINVSFAKGAGPGQTVPIIAQDKWGRTINWNYYRVVRGQGNHVDEMCERFFTWLDQRFVQTNQLERLFLEDGNCMVFHDLRCLHGREAFEASHKGDRCLWHLQLHWDRM